LSKKRFTICSGPLRKYTKFENSYKVRENAPPLIMTDQKPHYFTRDATGLVRSVGPFSGITFAIANTGYFFYLFFAATVVPDLGNSTDVVGGALIATVGVFFLTLVYYYFARAAPRTGGDYVWISRWLTPSVGFVSTAVGVVFVEFLYIGVTGITVETTGLSAAFGTLGSIFHDQSLVSLGSQITTPFALLVLATIWIWVPGLVVLFGAKAFFRMQNGIYIILFVAMAALLGTLAFTSSGNFVSTFNSYASSYTNTTDYYHHLISAASSAGWAPPGTSFLNMLLIVPLLIPTVGFGLVSYIGGEMRNTSRNWAISLFGGSMSFIIFTALGLVLAFNAFGFNFMSAVGFLIYANPSALTLTATPYVNYLASISAAGFPILVLILNFAVLQQMIYAPVATFATSRGLFAFSFDRLLPERMSRVNQRWNSPTYSVLVTLAAGEIMLFFFLIPFTSTYAYSFTGVAVLLGITFPYLLLGLTAIIFPWRDKRAYETSGIKGKIAGLPKITWAGLIVFIYMALSIYALLTNSAYAANTRPELELAGGAIVGAIVIYFVIYQVRKSQGISLSKAFAEIPPE
jgi:amino acid transporter